MSTPALRLIHSLYVAFVILSTWMQRRKQRQPNPLSAQRNNIPKHLCLNLVANDEILAEEAKTTFLRCLQRVAVWCRALGIRTLTVYDRHGMRIRPRWRFLNVPYDTGILNGCSEKTLRRVLLANETWEDSRESDVGYSGNLTLHIVSRASGKPAIVAATRSLLQGHVRGASMSDDTMPSRIQYGLTVSELATVLEG